MQSRNPELPSMPPPPAAIATLVKGFNAIASNIAVILFPSALDLFLWLGPRLKADALLAPFLQPLPPDLQAQIPADQMQIFTQFMTEFRNGLNLFSVLRTFPLGVFSLMSANLSPNSPFGARLAIDTPNWVAAFGIIMTLTLLGWVAGSLYFQTVSRVAVRLESGPGILLRATFQSLLLSAGLMVLFMMANIPVLLVLGLVAMLDTLVRTIVMLLLLLPAAWIMLVVYYSFYGIFVNSQNVFTSIRDSIRMMRYGLPPLVWFTMLIILISQGMDLLWRAAPADSWMTGVGIFGHAFISTSLLAASFIYYHELNLWIEAALQWLKKQNNSSAQA